MIIVIQKAIEGFKLGVANRTFDDRTQSNSNRSIDFNRLGSVIELSEKFQLLCSITEKIEQQSDRLGSIDFLFGFFRLATPG